MSRKQVPRTVLTPKPAHPNVLPLLKYRIRSETPTNLNSELNVYSYVSDNSFNLNTVNKFFTPKSAPKTNAQSVRVDTESLLENTLKNNEFSQWEITERVESYEIRTKTNSAPKDDFAMWNQCYIEIAPFIKRFNPDAGNAISKIMTNLQVIFKDTIKNQEEISKKQKEEYSEVIKKNKSLEEELTRVKNTLNEIQNEKRMEMEEIQKEIREIFGGEENEIQILKMKSKRFQEIANSGTSEFLKDLYNHMNKDFYIPEAKNHELPMVSLEDFSQVMNAKFRLLQKSTANRVYKIFEGNKLKKTVASQTIANYVNPKEHEEVVAQLEKVNLQYQSAMMQLEKSREDLGVKSNNLAVVENEKINLMGEVNKFKREAESLAKELVLVKKENEENKTNAEMLKNSGFSKQNSSELELLVNNQSSKITNLSKIIEQKESAIKEKDERIKYLENKLEKIRLGKNDKNDEEKTPVSVARPEKSKRSEKAEEMSAEVDRFDEIDLTRKRKTKKQTEKASISSFHHSSSKPYTNENTEESPSTTPVPTVSRGKISDSNFSKASSNLTQDLLLKSANEGNLPTRGNSRDTAITRDTPLARVDEYKEIKDFKDPRATAETREHNRIKVQNPKSDENKAVTTEYHIEKKNKQPRKEVKKNYESNNESDEDYQINKSMQWDLTKSNLHSQGSKRVPEFEASEIKTIIGKNGEEYSVVDKGVWTTSELKYLNVIECSKFTQVNEGTAENTESNKKVSGRTVYFLPYNPNNTYGLKGDQYFHTKQNVFSAQPKIPDLSTSIFFQNSYMMDTEKEEKSEKTSKIVGFQL